MKYQIAPMWFSKDLEKDKVFLTKRDPLCLRVLLNLFYIITSTGLPKENKEDSLTSFDKIVEFNLQKRIF